MAPETLLLNTAVYLLRLFVCMLATLLCLTCTPSVTTTSAEESPPPPPQCIISYVFTDLEGNDAFICVFDDTSVNSWNEYGAAVYHPYREGFIVGLAIDLPTLCSGDIPVCTTWPSARCVAPPQSWSAEDNDYALCRTNDGDDLLEFFGDVRRDTWYSIVSWPVSVVCMDE